MFLKLYYKKGIMRAPRIKVRQTSQPTFTCSKSTIEAPEQRVKSVQS